MRIVDAGPFIVRRPAGLGGWRWEYATRRTRRVALGLSGSYTEVVWAHDREKAARFATRRAAADYLRRHGLAGLRAEVVRRGPRTLRHGEEIPVARQLRLFPT